MAGNSIGKIFRLTSFGESHGAAIGGVIDGCPAGLKIDFEAIERQMGRRRPGQSSLVSPRDERDNIEWLSGIFENVTTGAPIAFQIRNKDAQSSDYNELKEIYRPGHADITYDQKYGRRDHRGGGRSSARETAVRVAAGALAAQLLALSGIICRAWVCAIGRIEMPEPEKIYSLEEIDASPARCPHPPSSEAMEKLIRQLKAEGDSTGGVIHFSISGAPVGFGEPVYEKLSAVLGFYMLGINAVKGFEIGTGFKSAQLRGSQNNDPITSGGFTQNNAGGILGGISTGQEIWGKVAFKPTSTIAKAQQSISKTGEDITLHAKGRHDPCVVPRAVPIVEAMASLAMIDMLLQHKGSRL